MRNKKKNPPLELRQNHRKGRSIRSPISKIRVLKKEEKILAYVAPPAYDLSSKGKTVKEGAIGEAVLQDSRGVQEAAYQHCFS